MMEIAKVGVKLGVPVGFVQPWLYKYVAQHRLMTTVTGDSGQPDDRCGLGTPIFQAWYDSLRQLLDVGKSLAIPDGFIIPDFGTLGAAVFIGELGGGVTQSEVDAYCDVIGAPRFKVEVVLVDGGTNDDTGLENAGGEVYLDVDCSARANDVS